MTTDTVGYEGVTWGYRLLLNRNPESRETIAAFENLGVATFRGALLDSAEFRSLLDRAGQTLDDFDDRIAGATWAYRFLLDRDGSADEVDDLSRSVGSINDLRLALVATAEYDFRGNPGVRDFAIVNAFAPFSARSPIDGAFQDIFGTVTKVDYLDPAWHSAAGRVYASVPRNVESGLHGTPEWSGSLRSVLEADGSLTVVELGAGWAPWLVVCQRAAARRGIASVDLIAVEGSADHCTFARDHFRTNGIDPDAHTIRHAVVGESDGTASFPKLHVAASDYGANAVFDEMEAAIAADRGTLETVSALSLATVIGSRDRVDLLHVDIQGHEAAVITSSIEILNRVVRRIIVGTHSRKIEGALFAIFAKNGWTCEYESACVTSTDREGITRLTLDGEQIWRNPRLRAASMRSARP